MTTPHSPSPLRPRFDAVGFQAEVGRRMQVARKARRMTQKDVADETGIRRATYANMEAGRQRIAADVLFRVGVVLRVSPSSLIPEPARAHV